VPTKAKEQIVETATSRTVLTGFEVFQFKDGTVHNDDSDPLVDDLYYYVNSPDVWSAHADADAHYRQFGWHENRNPNAFFNTKLYLSIYHDVVASGLSPTQHYDKIGWIENRLFSLDFDARQYLALNPDVAAAHIDPLAHFLSHGAAEGRPPVVPAPNGFDYVYYLQHNPDVLAAGVDPLQHFQTFGWKEGRNPNAFFDTAGEDLDSIDVMSTEAKYIANSDGIVLLLDPLQMSQVRDRLKDSVTLPPKFTEPIDIVGKTIELIQRFKGLSGRRTKIDIPLAVTFSKVDEILRLFDPGSPLKEASNHDGYFDVTDAEIVSENIKAHLQKWEDGNLDRACEKHFRNYSYFGISALGASPDASGRLEMGPAPFRVVDPILWILHRQGIIPGKRSRQR